LAGIELQGSWGGCQSNIWRRVPTLPRAVLLDEEHLFTNIACMKVRLLVNNLLTSHGLTGHSQEMSYPPLLR
jgi:hypothetical protein